MRSDADIKRDVEFELRWDPESDATNIGVSATDIEVSVKNSVVTLPGFVKSYGEKWQAEADAKRSAGVFGIANDIELRLPASGERPAPDTARDAVAAIKNELPDASDGIRAIVKNEWATLEVRLNDSFSTSGQRLLCAASVVTGKAWPQAEALNAWQSV